MSRYLKTEGIVLKESPLGENGKLLTLFTKDYGKITIAAKGVKKPGNTNVQISQLFAYSKFELYKSNSSLYTLTGGELIESFLGLSKSYESLETAAYMSKILLKVIQENLPEEMILRLLLNSLYFISTGKREPDLVKCIFVLKLLEYEGVAPDANEINLLYNNKLLKGSIAALEHIFNSDIESLFSFKLSNDVLEELTMISDMLLKEL